MLVLSRQRGEKIVIGQAGDTLTEPIVINAVDIRPDKVRLGIDAQRDIRVHRQEVIERIELEQRNAETA